ncbi:MAG: hypothetical protein H6Q89_371 [Myxococcaceae bacterium]|nr:hypothetical protein [Myxococcaceae bacterium]
MPVRAALFSLLLASAAVAGEKPCITYKAPPPAEDDRPVATAITVGPQGSDYAFKVDFNRAPWGDACGTRCANTTVFLDTDNDKNTGVKLRDPKSPITGADLSITIQGTREYKDSSSLSVLRIKVKQFSEEATTLEQGMALAELDLRRDTERINAADTTIYLLIDANIGSLPAGPKVRVVYQPPDAKPMIGSAKGLNAPGANRVEIFKEGKLSNPMKKKRSDYE